MSWCTSCWQSNFIGEAGSSLLLTKYPYFSICCTDSGHDNIMEMLMMTVLSFAILIMCMMNYVHTWYTILWKQIILAKYGYLRLGWDIKAPCYHCSALWRGISAMKEPFLENRRYKDRYGARIFFWLDTWVGEQPLASKLPELFNCAMDRQAKPRCKTIWREIVTEWFGPPPLDTIYLNQGKDSFVTLWIFQVLSLFPRRDEIVD